MEVLEGAELASLEHLGTAAFLAQCFWKWNHVYESWLIKKYWKLDAY